MKLPWLDSEFNAKEKRKLYTVVLVKMFSGFMDMVGVASIIRSGESLQPPEKASNR